MNANKKIVIVAVSTLVIGVLIGWLIFGRSSATERSEKHQHPPEIAGETVWTCSMHPQIRRDESGDCPICGMDLIPLDSEGDTELDPMAVRMSPTAMKLADISTATVGTMNPIKTVSLNGKVQEDERLVSSQSTHISGRIERLNVNFTGEYVRKGQVIAYIYSPELVTAQKELLEAEKIKDTQPRLFQSAKEKLKNWKLSDSQINRILESGNPFDEIPITADISGYVLSKNVNVGDYIQGGETIYKLANLSRVWVLFDVYEPDIPWVNKGDEVHFTIQSLPGKEFEGKISFLDPVIDPKTRVAKARVEIPNQDNQLKPEMFASGLVNAILKNRDNVLIIPKSAVLWTGKRSVVYIKNRIEKGVFFSMREVTLGPALGENYMIEEGLKIGEEIAVSGTFSIDAAAQLAGKPSMMNPGKDTSLTGRNPNILQPLYRDYLGFKDALTNDDADRAMQAAVDLQARLNKVNLSFLTGESRDAWMSYSSELKNVLQHPGQLHTLEELRAAFKKVSAGMIAIAKVFHPMEETLHIQFCPMADTNKGAYWLSTEEDILNPYFGKAMLSCGENKGVIK